MAFATQPGSGEVDDRVRIRLAGSDVKIVEEYTVHTSIFQQPAAFSLRLSGARGVRDLLGSYLPGPLTPFQLLIGPYPQFTGELDAANANGTATSTLVELGGRDLMARLFDTDIVGDKSFANASYEELFKAALEDCGLNGRKITIDPSASTRLRSGVGVKVYAAPVTVDEVRQTPNGPGFLNTVTAKLGETWLQFLERHFAKIGLFAWADANGNFILSRPNGDQEPKFHFFRKRGNSRQGAANVKSFRFTNDTTRRVTEVVIFARNGGRKFGHNHVHGGFVDVEMNALQFKRRRTYRDVNVTSEEEARFYARRKIAEANRAGWKLQYTVSGHSAPTMNGGPRATICPDMVARVDDEELGIHENLYIESCEYRSPPRETVVTLMRPSDLVFGEGQSVSAKKKAETNARRMLSFVRDRNPTSFVRDNNSSSTNQITDPTSRAFGLTLGRPAD